MTSLLRALALFTIAPVRVPADLDRGSASAALRWFPVVGAGVGAVAGLPMAAVRAWSPGAAWVGAVLSVCALVLLTRALHLDGLADLADGLGSRAPADRALEIMRQSDIGPFGVLALVLVLVLDVASVAAMRGGTWTPVAGLAVAAATGRTAVLVAAHPRVPSARTTGFGSYVAGSVSTPIAGLAALGTLALGVVLAAATSHSVAAWPVAQVGALLVTTALVAHSLRRLNGVTGDVFGAVVEVGTAAVLAGLALAG